MNRFEYTNALNFETSRILILSRCPSRQPRNPPLLSRLVALNLVCSASTSSIRPAGSLSLTQCNPGLLWPLSPGTVMPFQRSTLHFAFLHKPPLPHPQESRPLPESSFLRLLSIQSDSLRRRSSSQQSLYRRAEHSRNHRTGRSQHLVSSLPVM
jgi:hypothetical protein